MKIEIGKRASLQVERASSRWQQFRPSAPFLLEQEFEEALVLLLATPKVGVPYPTAKRPGLRRLLLRKSEHHIYYSLERDETLLAIHAVWGARRARGPKL